MRTSPACLPCFARQVAYTAGLATDSRNLQKKVQELAASIIASFDLELSPPENAVFLYRMIAEQTDNPDIFSTLKNNSNRAALNILPDLEAIVGQSPDPLRTTALLTIAGNIIDYGSQQDFNVNQTIAQCLTKDLAIDDLEDFRGDLERAEKILYLGDNCGELVFDRLLLKRLKPETTFVIKEKPIINDALRADAEACGLGQLCRIISNGTDCPGTPLHSCSDEFKKEFRQADLIISKGQGNFETLSDSSGPIYFFLMVKCPVVAAHLTDSAGRPPDSIKTGDMVLMKKRCG